MSLSFPLTSFTSNAFQTHHWLQNRFTAPEELEDELRARTAVLDVFNRTREDFADPAAYAAYADHVEDLSSLLPSPPTHPQTAVLPPPLTPVCGAACGQSSGWCGSATARA